MANLRTNNLCGRGFVSINDGTVWSSLFDGTTHASGNYPKTAAFDGNITTFMYPAAGTTITWNAPNGGIRGNKIRVRVYAGNTHPIVKVNDISTGAVVGGTAQQDVWVDVTEITGGVLKSITSIGETIGGVARQSGFSAVEIDGEILVDSLKGSKGGRSAISGSVFFDGDANTFLKCTDSDAWDFGADNFTIEYWFLESDRNRAERRVLYLYDTQQALVVGHTNDNGGQIFFGAHDSSQNLISGNIVTTSSNSLSDNDINQWMHVAITREGSNLKIYLNGILEVTDTGYSTTAIRSDQNDLFIGYDPVSTGREFKGYLSNLRICKGHAVYTSNFTPPYEQLEKHFIANDDLTSLLCCQDSDNPLQEATGKTLVASGSLVEGDDVELVTNSGFTADISGWTASGVQWSHSSGALMHFGNGNTQRNIYQDVTTVAGRRYVARVLASSAEANTAYWQVGPSDSMTTVNYVADNNNSGQLEYRYFFTATSSTTRIRFYSHDSSNSSNVRSYWYLASIKLAAKPIVPKVLPPYGTDAGNTFEGPINLNTSAYAYMPSGLVPERGRGRVVIFGSNANNTYIEMSSGGIAQLFGQSNFLIQGQHASCSSNTRAVRLNGYSPSTAPIACNVMEYVTIATQGRAVDFGVSTRACRYNTGFGSQTRGINANGNTPGDVNAIDYITIASTGDATNFGDLDSFTGTLAGSTSNSIRGLISGYTPGNNHTEYVTIATTGNGQTFGEATVAMQGRKGAASSTRALFASGYSQPTFNVINTIDYFTISTLGNAVDFGDLTVATGGAGGTSDSVRAVFMGGFLNPGSTNVIDVVTIATTGNATRFGDMYEAQSTADAAASDCHGGL